MSSINWKKIVAEVLRLIADGLDKSEAVKRIANKFDISVNELMKRIK